MSTDRYAPPGAAVADPTPTDVQYAGFWIRTGAALIDIVLIIAISWPLLHAIYGADYLEKADASWVAGPADFLISYVAPALVTILFWLRKQGTPGKLALSLRVVDAQTGSTLSLGQSIGRYLAYFPAFLLLGLGVFWVGFDARKQGWHDKLCNSVVVRARSGA